MKKVVLFCFLFWAITSNLLATGPVFVIAPDTINYGVIPVNEYSSGQFTVSNSGDETGEISFGTITGPGSEFILWNPFFNWIVPAGSTGSVIVLCYPSSPGTIDATGTIYTNDPQLPVFYLHFTGTVVTAVYSLSGTITYPNQTSTPLNGITLKLKDTNGAIINTATTNISGHYLFSNVQNGNYTLEVLTTKLWGGVTALDVMLYQKHIAGIAILTGIKLAAGDVNGSGTLSALDILLIRKRVGGISNSFPAGDWLFNSGPITISGSNVAHDFNGICYGDANGSYMPPLSQHQK